VQRFARRREQQAGRGQRQRGGLAVVEQFAQAHGAEEARQLFGGGDQAAAAGQVAAAIEGRHVDVIEILPCAQLAGGRRFMAFEVRLRQPQALEVQQRAHQPVQGLAGHALQQVAEDQVGRVGVAEARSRLRQRAAERQAPLDLLGMGPGMRGVAQDGLGIARACLGVVAQAAAMREQVVGRDARGLVAGGLQPLARAAVQQRCDGCQQVQPTLLEQAQGRGRGEGLGDAGHAEGVGRGQRLAARATHAPAGARPGQAEARRVDRGDDARQRGISRPAAFQFGLKLGGQAVCEGVHGSSCGDGGMVGDGGAARRRAR
jgi:hypothetical protein